MVLIVKVNLLLNNNMNQCKNNSCKLIFKPGACGLLAARAWFLEIGLVRVSVCVCVCVSVSVSVSVCPPPRPLITSGVIWCDIDCVRLVKQILRLFPAFNYFIRHLLSIKWMGVAILTQHVVNACQRKLR